MPTPIEIPRERIEVRTARSGGPGGQNVNKVETKVEIRVNLNEADWIPAAAIERLRTICRGRITRDDELIIASTRHREQRRNLEDCFAKLQGWLDAATQVPRKRRATRPTRASKKRRLDQKKRRGQIKSARRKPSLDD